MKNFILTMLLLLVGCTSNYQADAQVFREGITPVQPVDFEEHGTGDNVLIWFSGNGFDNVGTSLPSYLNYLVEKNMKVIVCDYETVRGNPVINPVKEMASYISYFAQNRDSLGYKSLSIGGNSAGANGCLYYMGKDGRNVDAMLLYNPQSTLHIDEFIGVLQTAYPSFVPEQEIVNRYTELLYGTLTPTEEQKEELSFLNFIYRKPVFISAFAASYPSNVTQMLHNRAHAVQVRNQTINAFTAHHYYYLGENNQNVQDKFLRKIFKN